MRKPSSLNEEELEDITARLDSGESLGSVARFYNMRIGSLYPFLARRGIHSKHRYQHPILSTTLRLPESQGEIGYIAGLIDGEGSIVLKRKGTSQWEVFIANTDVPLIDWLTSFGGLKQTLPVQNPKWKTRYRWYVSRKADVYLLLTATLPFLIIKKEKAEIALDNLKNHFETTHSLEVIQHITTAA